MKVVIFAALVSVAYAGDCDDATTGDTNNGIDGATETTTNACDCGAAPKDPCAAGGTFCLATAEAGKRCLTTEACTTTGKRDGSTVAGTACSCDSSDDACTDAEFCLATADVGKRCLATEACTTTGKRDGSTVAGTACSCDSKDDACTDAEFCLATADVGKRCLATPLCGTDDGSDANAADCNCKDKDDACTGTNLHCYAAGTAGKRCMAKALCDKTDGTAVAADCACGSSEAGDQCKTGQTCTLSGTEGNRCADAAAADAAGTAAAGSSTDAAAATLTADQAEALYETTGKLVEALTAADVKALLGTVPTGITYDKDANAPTMAGTGAAKVFTFPKVKLDKDDAAIKTAADKYFCQAIKLTDPKMCKTTYDNARRLSEAERQLAEAEYNVKAQMAAKEDFVAAKSGGASLAVTTSGASAFGIAVAIGLVALY